MRPQLLKPLLWKVHLASATGTLSKTYFLYPCLIKCQYPILSSDVTNHLTFFTSTMHAFVHQWGCQLIYNLHTNKLRAYRWDVERLWSRSRNLIRIMQMSALCSLQILPDLEPH